MPRFTVWTNTPGDNVHFYTIGTFSGADEAEALDNAAKDPGQFAKVSGKEGYESLKARNKALGFTRDNYKVKKVEE